MKAFLILFLSFYIYSIIGWIVETSYVSIKERKIANRGFLVGPYCPIYGLAAVSMIALLKGYKSEPITLFTCGTFIASTLEYLTSFSLEKIFKVRWWDYSNYKLNIDGRVCLINSLIFGLMCILLINNVNPMIADFIDNIPNNIFNVAIPLIFITFVIDCIVSVKTMLKIKKMVCFKQNLKKDYTEEMTDKAREILIEDSKKLKRISKAFPNVNIMNIFK